MNVPCNVSDCIFADFHGGSVAYLAGGDVYTSFVNCAFQHNTMRTFQTGSIIFADSSDGKDIVRSALSVVGHVRTAGSA